MHRLLGVGDRMAVQSDKGALGEPRFEKRKPPEDMIYYRVIGDLLLKLISEGETVSTSVGVQSPRLRTWQPGFAQ